MTPLGRIVREALPTRIALPVVAMIVVTPIRIVSGEDGWIGGEAQTFLALGMLGIFVPIFAIAMAVGWLRPEVAPWSWCLARPLGRWRWLGSILALDAATLLATSVALWLAIGPFPHDWHGPVLDDRLRAVAYLCICAWIYAIAAFAGARGSSSLAAAVYVTAAAAIAAFAARVGDTLLALGTPHVIDLRVANALGRGGHGTHVVDAPGWVALGTMLVMATSAWWTTRRAAARCPMRPPLVELARATASLVPLVGMVVLSVLGLVFALASPIQRPPHALVTFHRPSFLVAPSPAGRVDDERIIVVDHTGASPIALPRRPRRTIALPTGDFFACPVPNQDAMPWRIDDAWCQPFHVDADAVALDVVIERLPVRKLAALGQPSWLLPYPRFEVVDR